MKRSLALTSLALAVLSSCQVISKFDYKPPEQLPALAQNERIVNATYDETWAALISSIGKSFFAIDHFEKASGLLTLQFTSSPFSDSVDGGHCTFTYDNTSAVQGQAMWSGIHGRAMKIDFDGNYADYVERYVGGVFQGRINLVVTDIGGGKTKITVNTRFVVTGTSTDAGTGAVIKTTWAWNSGERSRQIVTTSTGAQEPRIMQSTNQVEKRILSSIDEIFASKGA